ncbi:sensor histidine kinase [Amycolatopsis sp. NPDC059021]|uniref:sensor histidine kinase n=1 Tax=Amycolatopsis sp. NPDC059021 TaxID=3346704 RepID=UPI0036720BC7
MPVLRSLLRPGTYRGLPYALAGTVITVPATPFALVAGVSMQGPTELKALGFLVTLGIIVGLMGLLAPMRRLGVWLANELLGTRITPPGPARPGWPDRLRSALSLVVYGALSWILFGVGGLIALTGMAAPLLWFNGGEADAIAFYGWKVSIEGGWAGAWTLLVGLVTAVLLAMLCFGATVLFRVLALVLLSPSAEERAAEAERRAAVLAQRNRLARELHDSIGHTLTTSTIQAAAAAELVEADPQLVRRALGTIEESSRSALEDLDHVLGLLREEPSAKAPQRTLTEIDVLASRARDAGTDVDLAISGPIGELPATVSREGYRIVQEGLTNALRHGGSGQVVVVVAAGPAALRIEVVNPLPGTGPRSGRRGLTGLTERVEALRGELHAGPQGELWRLTADIPLRPGS